MSRQVSPSDRCTDSTRITVSQVAQSNTEALQRIGMKPRRNLKGHLAKIYAMH